MTMPHPWPVMRVLKQAYRTYSKNCSITALTANVATKGQAVISGNTKDTEGNTGICPSLMVTLTPPSGPAINMLAAVDRVSGAFSATFAGLAAGTYSAKATNNYAPSVNVSKSDIAVT